MSRLGIVVIGRNEGERLRVCLRSVLGGGAPVVYVDSGSADGSTALATSMGATALDLNSATPFSAARARNEGFERLMQLDPEVALVQFVDGDCEVIAGWLERGVAALDQAPDAVVVCGRVLERRPEASLYNRLCALEWQKEEGEIRECGGIFLCRAAAFRAVGGFRPDVVAGEEGELCLRLRDKGGKILHVASDMVWHDSAMTRFSQWWKRARRAGHAYAQGAALHGGGAERHSVRDCRRIWFWGLILPLAAIAPAWPTRGISLALLALYPLQLLRVFLTGRRRGWTRGDSWLYAFSVMLAKFPGLLGLLQYRVRSWRGKAPTIIEHKGMGTPG